MKYTYAHEEYWSGYKKDFYQRNDGYIYYNTHGIWLTTKTPFDFDIERHKETVCIIRKFRKTELYL